MSTENASRGPVSKISLKKIRHKTFIFSKKIIAKFFLGDKFKNERFFKTYFPVILTFKYEIRVYLGTRQVENREKYRNSEKNIGFLSIIKKNCEKTFFGFFGSFENF